jgi:hypothetical protein
MKKLISLILLVLTACKYGPQNYDDCILENMKGVTNDTAAELIVDSCVKKFKKNELKKCETEGVPPWDIYGKIQGNGEISNVGSPYFKSSIYNGLSKSITEINVAISGDNMKPEQEYKLFVYPNIAPKSKGNPDVAIQADPGQNFTWRITSVKVCK